MHRIERRADMAVLQGTRCLLVVRCFLYAWMFVQTSAVGTASEPVDFDRDIAPIFQDHCVECHSADDRNGGLRLDGPSPVELETDSGEPTIVPGDSEASELWSRISTTSEDELMPPDGERLSDKQLELIRRWIDRGAQWSTESPDANHSDGIDQAANHWAFRPRQTIDIPNDPTGWAKTDIDRLVAARRQLAGVDVASDASPITFIRRATYDLTGLPPSPEEVDVFVERCEQTGMETAVKELVDRLLATSAYGERWGRHWMDWVRYADTAGDNSDYPIPQAYLYRNYIIDSLNQDVPYDRFVTEQIAGDLLPAESLEQRNRQTIATGYLAMARRFGSLVERYPWHLTIEDTIDNVGRTMLGMTLACARCHDHKFDPVSTREYYGLYGFFASTQYPFPGLELFQAQQNFVSLIDPAETESHLAKHQQKTDKLTAELNEKLQRCREQALENAEREKQCSLDEKRQMQDHLDGMLIDARRAGEKLAGHLKQIPDYPTAYAVSEATPTNAAIQIKGEPTRPGGIVQRGFPDVLGGQTLTSKISERSSGRLELADWITAPDNPLFARVIVNRVWQKHFGTGIVPSTSDFGIRGDTPTHPELLDYVANEFIAGGYSLKQLHRMLMTSRTYRLSSFGDTDNEAIDPNNHWLWRFNRQRLDAESLRDSLLLFSGELDRTPQTEPYPFPKKTDWTFTQHHPFKGSYPNNKRSVYQMTKRLTAETYLQTFDGADPNVCTAERDQSVTSLQALYFLNDDFVHQQSFGVAEILLKSQTSPQSRAAELFRLVLGRKPTDAESNLILSHVGQACQQLTGQVEESASVDVQKQAWASAARGMFRLNEFLYLD
ncbi:PSD1 and planctomycete cytochrome C domain-containing protein [Rhodopirellula sp. MGV]|uniref:PSD1 and planctomycete cytochrome C domain-containing protein n=1 Tax=Rhodopirellula sp. MGV TaxID=2023130 RepID=UPI000B95D668|nr:PSD1 and planctomycete cytochrome C domain-containing protein [Rhodopirellula sp. MGV]OYP38363.1 hypothetical protein CGZ80_02100 [Rhodopirellula sp. MGV]PNY34214.1 DUF1553 domain-containing protein [Rhodopirellula baltica]